MLQSDISKNETKILAYIQKDNMCDRLKEYSSFLKESRDPIYSYLKTVYRVSRGCFILPIVGSLKGRRTHSSMWVDLETYIDTWTKDGGLNIGNRLRVDIEHLTSAYY